MHYYHLRMPSELCTLNLVFFFFFFFNVGKFSKTVIFGHLTINQLIFMVIISLVNFELCKLKNLCII